MTNAPTWQDAVRQQTRRASSIENQEVMRRRYARWTLLLSVLNAVFTVVTVAVVLDYSEDWWLSGLLVHLPQVPLLTPSLALLGCSLVWHLRSGLVNLSCFAVVLFALCGYRVSLKPIAQGVASPEQVRIATCHVTENSAAVDQLLLSLRDRQVDVVALQGVGKEPRLPARYFPNWHSVRDGSYWVASRWPLIGQGASESKTFSRTSALNVEIARPGASFVLTNLQLTSAAGVINELSLGTLWSGHGRLAIERQLALREHEAFETHRGTAFESSQPQLVVGDFGVHPSSKVFRRHFGHLNDAFDSAGVGFGYTSPQQGGRFWPPRVAWMRSDMILSTVHWEPLSCFVLEAPLMDHNAVVAELRIKSL